MCIANEEVRRVDQNAVTFGGLDLESPDHGLGKRLFDRLFLAGVAGGTKIVIWLDQQHLVTGALKGHNLGRTQLAAIEPERI